MADAALPEAPDLSALSSAELVEVRDRLAVAGLHDEGIEPGMTLVRQVDVACLPFVLAALREGGDTEALLTRVSPTATRRRRPSSRPPSAPPRSTGRPRASCSAPR